MLRVYVIRQYKFCKAFGLIELYGKSIRDQSLVTRRNLNVKGLNASDLRTHKENAELWDFNKRADRHEARSKARPGNIWA